MGADMLISLSLKLIFYQVDGVGALRDILGLYFLETVRSKILV